MWTPADITSYITVLERLDAIEKRLVEGGLLGKHETVTNINLYPGFLEGRIQRLKTVLVNYPDGVAIPQEVQDGPVMLLSFIVNALKLQHEAIDLLLAQRAEIDHTFMPSQSPVWPAVKLGNEAMTKAREAIWQQSK